MKDQIFTVVNKSLVEFWKSQNLTESDFYCRDCGSLLIDLDEAKNIQYKPKLAERRNRFVYMDSGKRYVESPFSRWSIVGRELSGKIFFRHLCWDCFFRRLPEIEDIPKRARKGKWYAAVMRGEKPIPKAWTSPSEYFKTLFDMTDDELQAERSKFDTASLESFIRRHGEEQGRLKYEEYRARQAYTCSKEYMLNEKGMSEDDWKNYNMSRASTRENFVKRYGKDLGDAKWKQYCYHEAYAGCTLEYFQEKYGDIDGKRKYYDVCHEKAITLSNFIKKYGEEAGKNQYEKMMHRRDGVGYSIISQRLFAEVDSKLGESAVGSKWASKNFEEDIEIIIDGVKKFAKPDYILGNKIIEFNGDYWHANPKFYKPTDFISYPTERILASEVWFRDAKRLNAIKDLGYKIFIIWENEFNSDPIKKIDECVAFLKS